MASDLLIDDMLIVIAELSTITTCVRLRLTCRHFYNKLCNLVRDRVMHDDGLDGSACVAAARSGNQEILKLLRKNPRCTWNSKLATKIATAAAKGGHFRIVKWCLRHTSIRQGIYDAAAKHGQLKLLKWLEWLRLSRANIKYTYISEEKIACAAALKGQKDILVHITHNFYAFSQITAKVFEYAALYPDLSFLCWLYQKCCDSRIARVHESPRLYRNSSIDAFEGVVRSGRMEAVELFVKGGHKAGWRELEITMERRDFEMFQYLYQNGNFLQPEYLYYSGHHLPVSFCKKMNKSGLDWWEWLEEKCSHVQARVNAAWASLGTARQCTPMKKFIDAYAAVGETSF